MTCHLYFAKHLISHIGTGKKQINGHGTSKLLNALHLHHQGQISEELMLNITRVEGFKCVLDAFHNLPARQQSLPFFEKAVIEKKQGITLADHLFELFHCLDFPSIADEVEGRWNLVESA